MGIDLGQQVASLHDLAFGKTYLFELPIHSAFDGDRIVRKHGSDRGNVLIQIAKLGRRGGDRDDRMRHRGRRLCRSTLCVSISSVQKVKDEQTLDKHQPEAPSLTYFVD